MLFYPLYKKESLRFRKEKGMSYISVEHLSFSYEQETVLEDISFTVEPGQFVILTGKMGRQSQHSLKIFWDF